jgi:hypothetical protein
MAMSRIMATATVKPVRARRWMVTIMAAADIIRHRSQLEGRRIMRQVASLFVPIAMVLTCAALLRSAAAAPPPEIAVAPSESLQAAIDKAPAGATIKLAEGIYPEAVLINKPLTLQGAGWEKTTVGPDKQPPLTQKDKDEFFAALDAASSKEDRVKIAVAFASGQLKPTVTVKTAKDVTLRGIKFRGPAGGNPDDGIGPEALVTFDNAAAGTISECAIVGPFMNGVTAAAGRM